MFPVPVILNVPCTPSNFFACDYIYLNEPPSINLSSKFDLEFIDYEPLRSKALRTGYEINRSTCKSNISFAGRSFSMGKGLSARIHECILKMVRGDNRAWIPRVVIMILERFRETSIPSVAECLVIAATGAERTRLETAVPPLHLTKPPPPHTPATMMMPQALNIYLSVSISLYISFYLSLTPSLSFFLSSLSPYSISISTFISTSILISISISPSLSFSLSLSTSVTRLATVHFLLDFPCLSRFISSVKLAP